MKLGKRAWVFAIALAALLAAHWAYGPGRVPEGKVVFYGAAWCPYSGALRKHLAASKIPYEERNVDDSFANLVGYMLAAGKKGALPVVQVGPRVVSKGFYQRDIDAALVRAGFNPDPASAGPEGGSERR
jgi:glutaredoxin